ncbi:MAG: hypothetical protein ACXABO_08735 [Promethearchaeota archaeon]|jgi:hypothetical protein
MIKSQTKNLRRLTAATLLILIIVSSFGLFLPSYNTNKDKTIINEKSPDNSGLWAKLKLTNLGVNDTDYYHNETIPIEGRLYEYLNEANGIDGFNVSLYVNGILMLQFNNQTHNNGIFNISFTIPFNLNIHQTHKIEANVTDSIGNDVVELQNFFTINIVPYTKLNLTNYQINDTDHYHTETIPIKGRIYEYFNDTLPVSDIFVSLFVDGQLIPTFNDTTDINGNFSINYTISQTLSFYQPHRIKVNISQGIWVGDVELQNFFIINIVPWAKLNLTSEDVNNSRYYHNSAVLIEGRIFEYMNDLNPFSGFFVSLFIDGQVKSQFNDTTDVNGEFQINYVIPFNLDVYQTHKIEVNVTQGVGVNEVELQNYFNFYTNATSVFDIVDTDPLIKIAGEALFIDGFLRYDNLFGEGISNVEIFYHWFNSSYKWSLSSFFTNSLGSFSINPLIPTDVSSPTISLNISFPGDLPNIGYSEIIIPNIKLFQGITCLWNVVPKATEGTPISIAGQIVETSNNSLSIYNRTFTILYDLSPIGTFNTDDDGFFSYTFTIPALGVSNFSLNKTIQIELVSTLTPRPLSNTHILNVTAAPPSTPPSTLPPFLMFSLIFFPILIGVVAVLSVFGYRYYKKQEKESRVVKIQLDPKIQNLKILKETGRLEESLSYLFNAIFMSLIEAKYGRIRKENETIRDFAIVSVKELKLTPSAIYPFIQNVESIIYGKPFKITESEFYQTCELFSPIYFELTSNNFVLNF